MNIAYNFYKVPIKANGQLPVTVNDRFKAGSGKILSEITRLKYTLPEELGIRSELLGAVDSIAQFAIKSKATPGCQVLIAKNGKVFYNKAFGSQTYSATSAKVKTTDLYDIASITKVAASTISIMRLTDEHFIDIDKTIGDYIPFLKATN